MTWMVQKIALPARPDMGLCRTTRPARSASRSPIRSTTMLPTTRLAGSTRLAALISGSCSLPTARAKIAASRVLTANISLRRVTSLRLAKRASTLAKKPRSAAAAIPRARHALEIRRPSARPRTTARSDTTPTPRRTGPAPSTCVHAPAAAIQQPEPIAHLTKVSSAEHARPDTRLTDKCAMQTIALATEARRP